MASITLAGKDRSFNLPLACRRAGGVMTQTQEHNNVNAHGLLSGPESVQPLTASSKNCSEQGNPSALDILAFPPLMWGQHQKQNTDASWGPPLGLPSEVTATSRSPQISEAHRGWSRGYRWRMSTGRLIPFTALCLSFLMLIPTAAVGIR